MLLLFLGLLRSPRYLLVVALPVAAGVAVATALGLLLFGRLHGLTLAFGATLVGVAVDYPVHLTSHHLIAPEPAGPDATLRRIRPALLLGALTTVAGLAGLGWTALPGIREMALFAASGVAAALLTTFFVLPALLPGAPRPALALGRLAALLARLVSAMGRRRRLLALLPAAAIATCALGLPGLRWVDEVSALNRLEPALLAEDRRVRERVSQMDAGRFVVALGAEDEAALRLNDEVHERLAAAARAGELAGFSSIQPFLPSADLQRRNLEAVRAAPRLFERTVAALEAEGFQPAAFAPFSGALASAPEPLRFGELEASPLGELVRPFRTRVGDRVGYLTFLRGVEAPEALARRLEGLDGVVYFDQGEFLGEVYAHARNRTLQLALAGLVAVLALILVRYRRAGPTLAAFAPAVLAAGSTLAILAVAGLAANLLHLVGLLLVLSIGVDYGVFMVESRERPGELGATAVSLVFACLSTVLAFGLLAVSTNPGLRAIGLTTGIGVLLSLVLAPTALVLLAPSRPEVEP